ncbi:MAG TPA: helix-turn-helix transcriptional regulator [Pseudonocardia sp.]|jgi:transcriptional regulator with XRE-family HTH domain|uniref:helix-turn-helix domain-containing protein n=1 Tax=Pseudonocardia sp. TaxID=60912 RepID=UPI002BD6781C|nr:helix-turn-helix transcriptional regulator [Pseudonocardia sp.]HTF46614.1 helix-turn-helix transcriptional regulator [Pseudonocardia sp.]
MTDRQPCGLPIAGLVRAVRRRADLSQRELAGRAGVSPSSVSRLEAGTLTPSLGMLSRLMRVADVRLVAVDSDGHVIPPVRCWADTRDGADRHYPAHLDTILDPRPGEWWADRFGLARPPETFHRDRALRDAQRARSQWEVRVAKYWATPEPPVVPDRRWRRVD